MFISSGLVAAAVLFRLVAVAVPLVLLWLAAPAAALAHAVVVGTDPPAPCALVGSGAAPPDTAGCGSGPLLAVPPTTVHVRFSEPVAPFGGGIQVLGPSGRRVERGPLQTDGAELSVPVDAAEPGTYLVRWRITAEDTHPARGSFAFSVGRASGPAAAQTGADRAEGAALLLQAVGRWLHFFGYALGFGTLAFRLLVRGAVGLAPGGSRWRLVGWGVVLLLLAEPFALLGQTASLDPDAPLAPEAISSALDSAFGRALGLRVGAAIGLWVLVGAARDGAASAERAILVLGGLLALLDGRTAHAASGGLGGLVLPLSALHLMAAGVWAGVLAAWLAARPALESTAAHGALTRTFGRVALAALGVQAATGLLLAALRLSAPLELATTPYGLALVLKLVLLLGALGAAALALRAPPPRARRWRWLEAAALVGILALAGLLVSLPPPRPWVASADPNQAVDLAPSPVRA
jgi:copper transport protein